MLLGSFSGERGYTFDDVSVDLGLIWRNELRLPFYSPIAEFTDTWATCRPIFADVGCGSDHWSDRDSTIAGVGAGLDCRIADNLDLDLATTDAFKDAALTDTRDITFNAFLRARF